MTPADLLRGAAARIRERPFESFTARRTAFAVADKRAALRRLATTNRGAAMTEINEEGLTVAHKAVEDVLIEFRNKRISVLDCANGFVVNEHDGTRSSIMRMGTRDGLRIGIKAYLAAAEHTEETQT